MFIDVVFTHGELEPDFREPADFVAVIDVLRATTTMTTALENGARGIIPVSTPEEARRLAADSAVDVVLGGERNARLIPGFHLGNSPLEYTREAVEGKIVVMTTTNGSQAFERVQRLRSAPEAAPPAAVGAEGLGAGAPRPGAGEPGIGPGAGVPSASAGDRPEIVATCLRNVGAVARAAAERAAVAEEVGHGDHRFSILIVCAGTDGRFSWDDAYCSGVLTAELTGLAPAILGDGARAALNMIAGVQSRSMESGRLPGESRAWPGSREQLARSRHGKRLVAMGLEEDVDFCGQTNVVTVVPRLNMGMLI